MLRYFLAMVWLLMVSGIQAQNVRLDDFRFRGLEPVSPREAIVQALGKPIKEYRPQYECGFFSEAEQGCVYWELDYGYARFIGNEKEGYTLQKIHFSSTPKPVLYYKGQALDGKTTRADLLKMWGPVNSETFRIPLADSDAALLFRTQNNRLVSFEYWTPC